MLELNFNKRIPLLENIHIWFFAHALFLTLQLECRIQLCTKSMWEKENVIGTNVQHAHTVYDSKHLILCMSVGVLVVMIPTGIIITKTVIDFVSRKSYMHQNVCFVNFCFVLVCCFCCCNKQYILR